LPGKFNYTGHRMHFDERYFSQMIDARYKWKNEVQGSFHSTLLVFIINLNYFKVVDENMLFNLHKA